MCKTPRSPLLEIENLSISFGNNKVIDQISYTLKNNEILGVVGESGSGKSVAALAILGLLPERISKITSGHIRYKKNDLTTLSKGKLQQIRGKRIAMIFQEPMSALNPSMSCGLQVQEVLMQHEKISKIATRKNVLKLFQQVQLPNPERIFKAYPHALSGGQKQRVMIAMAIACNPDILIADEPTTALDVTVQKELIKLLKHLQETRGMSIIFISHDLALISEIANRVLVMYKGHIVEQGTTTEIFQNPREDYTKALIDSRPKLDVRWQVLPTIQDYMAGVFSETLVTPQMREKHHKTLYAAPPLLEVINLRKNYFSKPRWWSKAQIFKAVDGISFKLYAGETLGLVGESGCGKSTLARTILQLDRASSGSILYKGRDITSYSKSQIRALRKEIQIIFQDPYASLNPRLSVGAAIMEPMKVHGRYTSAAMRKEKTLEILRRVGLSEKHFNRYPHEFSGGQRQRIGIARAIAVAPQLIICDESVSALDISVQAQVLNLLNSLKTDFGFTYIFISHDLAVVKYMADQLLVMNQGRIVEVGEADALYKNPQKTYTRNLIEAIPKGT